MGFCFFDVYWFSGPFLVLLMSYIFGFGVKSYGQTLELHNHTKHFEKKNRKSNIWEKKKSVLWNTSCDSFFTIKILEFSLVNTKLFSIELAFWIFSNHSIPMLESNVMTETLKLHNHIKPCKNVNPTWRWKPYHFPFFAYIKSLMPPFVSIHPRVC